MGMLAEIQPVAQGAPTDAASGFDSVNAALRDLMELAPAPSVVNGRDLAPGVCVNFAGGAGVLAELGADDGFHLTLRDRGASDWLTLEIALPLGDLRQHRFLGLHMRARADHAMTLAPVLRLTAGDAWTDLPLPRALVATPAGAENTMLAPLAQDDALAAAEAARLILFIQSRRFDLRVTHLEVLHVR